MARELEQLEYTEDAAASRADVLESAASLARVESRLARVERDRTEELLLETVAAGAEADAVVHESVAAKSRREAEAAERVLRQRKRRKSAKK